LPRAKDRNEVDAALEVIGLIDLKGKIVTADALHCNRRMVDAIVDKGGDYCIALKGNQGSLLSDARGTRKYVACSLTDWLKILIRVSTITAAPYFWQIDHLS
jgi:predicted transposase YbfD/YdcC